MNMLFAKGEGKVEPTEAASPSEAVCDPRAKSGEIARATRLGRGDVTARRRAVRNSCTASRKTRHL